MLIRRHDPNARIVFVTVHAESMFVEAGLEAGALGYVLKDSAGDELVAAIRAALSGRGTSVVSSVGWSARAEN